MKYSLLILLVLTFWSGQVRCQEIVTGYYQVRRSQRTPLEVLNRGLKISRADIYGKALIDNLVNYNPHIDDWENLKAGQQLYVELPISIVSEATLLALHSDLPELMNKSDANQKETTATQDINTVNIEEKPLKPQRKKYEKTYIAQDDGSYVLKKDKPEQNTDVFSLSLFYANSAGSFEEVTTNQVKSTTNENSPVTLGFSGGYRMNEKESLSMSMYYSMMNPVAYDNQLFTITDEVGWNLYYQTGKSDEIIFHGGLDYESFSLFNTLQYEATGESSLSLFSMLFLTAGASKLVHFGDWPVFFRLGFSKTINSSVQGALINYHGEKFIFFVSIPIFKNVSLTSFYKTHFLSGDTQLSINRIGFGLNFSIL